MDAIKGTMTEIYNDLSKNTTGSTIAEVRDGGELPLCSECLWAAVGRRHGEASLEMPPGAGPVARLAQRMGIVGEGISPGARRLMLRVTSSFFIKPPQPEPELIHW